MKEKIAIKLNYIITAIKINNIPDASQNNENNSEEKI